MNIIVQKYGGTSLETLEKIEYAIKKIKAKTKYKNKVVVVVSAQGKTTDKLVEKSKKFGGEKGTKELDMLLSIGELESAALFSMLMNKNGIDTIALSGREAGIITDSNYGKADIIGVYPDRILEELNKNKVVVVAGFQGVDKYGYTTTLGRGGSDFTAVILAKALHAKTCEIYSDIDGVYAADPKIVKDAQLLEKIRMDEMLELATAGAKVMHNSSIMAAMNSDTQLFVKNAVKEERGTELLKKEDIFVDDIVKITKKDKLSKVTLVGHGYISRREKVKEIVDILDKEKINTYMIQISEISVSLLVDEEESKRLMNVLNSKLNMKS